MVVVKVKRTTAGGQLYLKNACGYVENLERSVGIGGYGADPYNPQNAFRQMMTVKEYYTKTSGNPLMHIVVSFDGNVPDAGTACAFAPQIATYFYGRYQTVWYVHGKDRGCSHYYVHILINSVSYPPACDSRI